MFVYMYMYSLYTPYKSPLLLLSFMHINFNTVSVDTIGLRVPMCAYMYTYALSVCTHTCLSVYAIRRTHTHTYTRTYGTYVKIIHS